MTEEQRKRAIHKFHSAGVHEVRIPSTTSQPPRHDNPPVVSKPATTASSSATTSQSLSVSVEDLSAMCVLPNCLVVSESSSVPHYVLVKSSPSCSYRCDQNCQNFSAMQICSHVVAAAEVNGELALYINSFKKAKGKQPANMTRVAKQGLPAGAGQKVEKPTKKKPPCQEPPSDGNRVPFSPQSQVPFSLPSQVLSSIVGVNSYGPQPTMPIYNSSLWHQPLVAAISPRASSLARLLDCSCIAHACAACASRRQAQITNRIPLFRIARFTDSPLPALCPLITFSNHLKYLTRQGFNSLQES